MSEEKKTNEQEPVQKKEPRNKPVVIYIMILFIAAFLLMALSLMMHQRTTAEGIGQLQHSFSTMQDMQEHQEKVIELQDQLVTLQDENNAQQEEILRQEKVLEAMTDLYRLQTVYTLEDYEGCQDMIRRMEASGSVRYLPTEITEAPDITPPSEQYAQIKAAVTAYLEENA